MEWMAISGFVMSALALGIVLTAALALAWDWRNGARLEPPGLLALMMRRYGVSRRGIEAAGLGAEFTIVCRKCETCQRTMQCANWLHDSESGDVPLFCANERFLARARAASRDSSVGLSGT